MDDSNFDMENYSSLVNVKLLLKRILTATEINFFVNFVLQFAANGRANSEIGYTIDCFYSFEAGRKLNSVCRILLLVPLQTYIWQKNKKIGHC